jgi:hypothetical protein
MSTYERPDLLEPGRQPTYEREVERERGVERGTERETTTKVVAGGSAGEAVAGLAAVVLAIIGLAGLAPSYMVAIATIVAGVALFIAGGAIAAQVTSLVRQRAAALGIGNAATSDIVGGLAGIVLGILGLIGIAPAVLLPIAAIVLGASLLFSAGAADQLTALAAGGQERPSGEAVPVMAASAKVMIGLASIVLGIVAVVGVVPLTLTLVAMLVIGCGAMMSAAALGGNLMSATPSRR